MCRNTFGKLFNIFNFKTVSTNLNIPILTMVYLCNTVKAKEAFYELKHQNFPKSGWQKNTR